MKYKLKWRNTDYNHTSVLTQNEGLTFVASTVIFVHMLSPDSNSDPEEWEIYQ